eukprot:CAMPEP_0119573168 /NCGR_PEP_ID=MMETSP1352-20130426/44988_1 /TAXON_ID=265584 /ORGANISM="Stauroneis constricta, Strain CCMP1120" /LENGTH=70 /DNA_ID=CAMNT_0007622855 /DNA_START=467 /DNA_END=676 /DNA_ORIENTATION=+
MTSFVCGMMNPQPRTLVNVPDSEADGRVDERPLGWWWSSVGGSIIHPQPVGLLVLDADRSVDVHQRRHVA